MLRKSIEKELIDSMLKINEYEKTMRMLFLCIGFLVGLVLTATICIIYFDFGNYTSECIDFCLNISNNSCDIPIEYLNLEDFMNN